MQPETLTLRKAQIAALRASFKQGFEDDLVARIERRFPERYADLGKTGVRRFIRKVVRICAEHDIRGHRATSRLIELMVNFGLEFELSPEQDEALDLLRRANMPERLRIRLIDRCLTAGTFGRRIVP